LDARSRRRCMASREATTAGVSAPRLDREDWPRPAAFLRRMLMGFKAISAVFRFPVRCKNDWQWWNFQNPPVCNVYSTLEMFCSLLISSFCKLSCNLFATHSISRLAFWPNAFWQNNFVIKQSTAANTTFYSLCYQARQRSMSRMVSSRFWFKHRKPC